MYTRSCLWYAVSTERNRGSLWTKAPALGGWKHYLLIGGAEAAYMRSLMNGAGPLCLNTAINVKRYTVNPQSTFIAGLYVRPAVQRQIGHLSVLTFTALGLNWH